MEIYDIIMLVVLASAAILGAIKGFAWQVASIASIAISYYVAVRFREPFSQQIQADPPWNLFLAMLILFVGTMVASWLFFRMIAGVIDRMHLRSFDRLLGSCIGLVKGVIYCVLITMFAVSLSGDSVRSKIIESQSGYYIARLIEYSDKVMPDEVRQVVGPYLDKLDQHLHSSRQQSFGSQNDSRWQLAPGDPNATLTQQPAMVVAPRYTPYETSLPTYGNGQDLAPEAYRQAQQPASSFQR